MTKRSSEVMANHLLILLGGNIDIGRKFDRVGSLNGHSRRKRSGQEIGMINSQQGESLINQFLQPCELQEPQQGHSDC